MQTVWRIVTRRFAVAAFDGEGARRFGGRWNRAGDAMVYTAQSRSLALLEMLVQDEPLRAHYLLIPAQLPANLSITHIKADQLDPNWRHLEGRQSLQAIGHQWLQDAQSCVLQVPSAVMPAEHNFLINPLHPEFSRIKIGPPETLDSDVRLLRNLSAPRSLKPV